MSETYKFNVGDKVDYPKTVYVTKVCPCCGHEDTDVTFEPASGVITHRKYDVMYSVGESPVISESFTDETGKTFHRPFMAIPQVNKPEPVYTVGGEWLRENQIQLSEKSNGQGSQKG